jgi:hypothetical protein
MVEQCVGRPPRLPAEQHPEQIDEPRGSDDPEPCGVVFIDQRISVVTLFERRQRWHAMTGDGKHHLRDLQAVDLGLLRQAPGDTDIAVPQPVADAGREIRHQRESDDRGEAQADDGRAASAPERRIRRREQ